MSDNQGENTIDREAFDWVTLLDRGIVTPDQRRALEAWLSLDTRHRGAFVRARSIWHSTERIRAFRGMEVSPHQSLESSLAPHFDRGFTRRGMIGTMCAGLTLACFFPEQPSEGIHFYLAQNGLLRPKEFGLDGIVLDQAAMLGVQNRSRIANLDLLTGRMRVKTQALPVHLVQRGMTLDITDGSVIAKTDGNGSEVLVLEGRASLLCLGDRSSRLLRPNDWIKVTRHRVFTATVSDEAREHMTAWSRGLLECRSSAVAEVVRELNRYNRRKIIIHSRRLEEKTISGLFSLDDAEGFARILSSLFSAEFVTTARGIEIFQTAG